MTVRTQRVAAYAVIVDANSILLVRAGSRSSTPNRWYLSGGGVEFGEAPAAAAIREVEEETGLRISLDPRVEVLHDVIADTHSVRLIYRRIIEGGALRNEDDGITDLAAWFPITTIPDAAMPFIAAAIEALGYDDAM